MVRQSRKLSHYIMLALSVGAASASCQSGFNVLLRLNFESAEEAINLSEGVSGNPDRVAQLRGSQIALATTSLLAQRPLSVSDLAAGLQGAKFNNITGDDIFRIREARSRVAGIKALVEQCAKATNIPTSFPGILWHSSICPASYWAAFFINLRIKATKSKSSSASKNGAKPRPKD